MDISLEDTLETLKRIDFRALAALPATLTSLAKARLYFIDGLEPYRTSIGELELPRWFGGILPSNVLFGSMQPRSKHSIC